MEESRHILPEVREPSLCREPLSPHEVLTPRWHHSLSTKPLLDKYHEALDWWGILLTASIVEP